jgi:hypothetical protein
LTNVTETAKEELQAAIDLHKQEDDDVQRWVRKKQKLAFERGQFAIDYSVRKVQTDTCSTAYDV